MSRQRSATSAADVDRRARFEVLFREVYEPLQTYARRRTDRASADDVVADALLVLWRRLDQVPADLALPWSYGVARRCLANHRRGEHRRDALSDRLMAERADTVAFGSVPGLASGDHDQELESALADLAADDREILRLWAWEQLQPKEIAVVLDISPNAAAIRVHRAKQRLSEAMERKSAARGGHTSVGHAKEAP